MTLKQNPLKDFNLFIERIKKEFKHKGFNYVFFTGIVVIYRLLLFYLFIKRLNLPKTFNFNGRNYSYFYHWYNVTWRNERAVEIPILYEFINKHKGKEILEIGNVLSYYFPVSHDIVDKYDLSSGIIREDIIKLQTSKRYDLIFSISTLEHVGWDDKPRDLTKINKAITNLRSITKSGGKIIFTFPLGYNDALDNLIKTKKQQFDRIYILKRTSQKNIWKQVYLNNDVNEIERLCPLSLKGEVIVGIVELYK